MTRTRRREAPLEGHAPTGPHWQLASGVPAINCPPGPRAPPTEQPKHPGQWIAWRPTRTIEVACQHQCVWVGSLQRHPGPLNVSHDQFLPLVALLQLQSCQFYSMSRQAARLPAQYP